MSAREDELEAVHYPDEDDSGEHELQRFIAELLRPMIARWLGEHGRVAHAGADTFFYFVPGDPTQRYAPDVYVIDGLPQDIAMSSYKTWEIGRPPAFAFEIVTSNAPKDYQSSPSTFARLGGRELVLFDAEAKPKSRTRARFTVFRRVDGELRMVEQTHGDRVFSEYLGCHLRAVGEGDGVRVRLGVGEKGETLVPTLEEEVLRLRDELAALRR